MDTRGLVWQAGGDRLWQAHDANTASKRHCIGPGLALCAEPAVPGPDASGWLQSTVPGLGIFRD